jgi:hypothetical protein
MEDAQKDPAVVIMYLLGRQLRAAEIYAAFGLSRSGYRKAREEGRLLTADNLMRVAEHFDLNPIELLTRFGLIRTEEVTDFVESVESEPHFGRTTTRREASRRGLRHANPRTDIPAL